MTNIILGIDNLITREYMNQIMKNPLLKIKKSNKKRKTKDVEKKVDSDLNPHKIKLLDTLNQKYLYMNHNKNKNLFTKKTNKNLPKENKKTI